MRIVTLCLLVLATTSCLLGKVESSAGQPASFEKVEPYNAMTDLEEICKIIFSTVESANCGIKHIIEVMIATSNYIEALESCSTDIPKDIAKIIKSCKKIYSICDDIIHLNSTICAHDEDAKMTGLNCALQLTWSVMSLTRNINIVLKQMYNLPFDTEACYVDSTNDVIDAYESFVPNLKTCA